MATDYWKWHKNLALAGLGFMLPALPIGYGIRCLWTGNAWFPAGKSNGPGLELPADAIPAIAIAFMALGLFLHVHFFWKEHRGAGRPAEVAGRLLAAVFLPCLAYAFFRGVAPY